MSVVAAVVDRGRRTPDQLALLENTRGRWHVVTAGELAGDVAALAAGMADAGIEPGDHVAILLGATASWLRVDLAVQAAGAVSVAVPDDGDDDALAQLLDGLALAGVVVDDPVQLQRIDGLVASGRLDPIGRIWQLGPSDEHVAGLDDVSAAGRVALAAAPGRAEAFLTDAARERPAIVCFTAGAGGRSRAVAMTAGAVASAAERVAAARGLGPLDVGVVALDPAHPFERAVTIYPALVSGAVLAFAETRSTVGRAMVEIQPTFAHLSAEDVRRVAAELVERLAGNRGVKRILTKRWGRQFRSGSRPSAVARFAMARPVRRTLGWSHLRSLVVTSVPLPGHVVDLLGGLDVSVAAGYVVSEAGGLVALGRPGGTFRPLDGVPVDVDPDGLVTVDGVATDDLGAIAAGELHLHGPRGARLPGDDEQLATTIEAALRESPYVVAALVSVRSATLHAAVEVDRIAVGAWATHHGHHFTTYPSLVAIGEVQSLIAAEVTRLAPSVVSHELLQRPLQQGREITRTGTTVHRRLQPAGTDQAPTDHASTASALE